ncbi:uncharacterized protein LOC129565567 [Sitodiplosis mosellana]|uniref:uncharacterized protein LOC129565567 n=1 Tax=Sitodiplosis mosellana TaxID=263140 RepID=UPI002445330B|nr:uncharacterized protein LOC129565567 [Sitodiplosis mosellana]
MLFNFLPQFNWYEIWSACNATSHNRINSIFWIGLFYIVCFHYFKKILQPHLRASKLSYYKWNLTVRYVWNICFYIVAIAFLYVYQKYFLADSLYFKQNGQNYYRSYENLIFFTSNHRCNLLNSVNYILISFYLIDVIFDLNEGYVSEAVSKFLACGIVICFDVYRLEYFSVMFNILLALIYLFTDGLSLVGWHIPKNRDVAFRVCVTLKLLLWSFVFLNLLPFKFLIPTLYGRKFFIWLNSFFLLWYGSCIWNSPILQYFYHQIYHTNSNSNDCLGERSVSRCILIKETRELRHLKNIRNALIEIQLNSVEQKDDASHSMKTYQTIKCMIALKRKLKRIRENKEQFISS